MSLLVCVTSSAIAVSLLGHLSHLQIESFDAYPHPFSEVYIAMVVLLMLGSAGATIGIVGAGLASTNPWHGMWTGALCLNAVFLGAGFTFGAVAVVMRAFN